MRLSAPARVEMALPGTSACLRAVREIVTDSCGKWGMSPEEADDAAMVAHEIVINALAARVKDDPLLIMTPRDAGVLIKVIDDSPGVPVRSGTASDSGESGRGLTIIEELASAWGFDLRDPARKEVWAVIRKGSEKT